MLFVHFTFLKWNGKIVEQNEEEEKEEKTTQANEKQKEKNRKTKKKNTPKKYERFQVALVFSIYAILVLC